MGTVMSPYHCRRPSFSLLPIPCKSDASTMLKNTPYEDFVGTNTGGEANGAESTILLHQYSAILLSIFPPWSCGSGVVVLRILEKCSSKLMKQFPSLTRSREITTTFSKLPSTTWNEPLIANGIVVLRPKPAPLPSSAPSPFSYLDGTPRIR